MSNGGACCRFAVCCPPLADGSPSPKQVEALAGIFAGWQYDDSWTDESRARDFLAHSDLAPRGLTAALLPLMALARRKMAEEPPLHAIPDQAHTDTLQAQAMIGRAVLRFYAPLLDEADREAPGPELDRGGAAVQKPDDPF